MFDTVFFTEVMEVEYTANSGIWGTMFGVPFVVADNFLKLATGEQLKVLLYLLRCSGRPCSDEEIARNTGVSPAEAADAVLFWQQVNVIAPQGTVPEMKQIIQSPQPVRTEAPAVQESIPQKQNEVVPQRRKQTFTPSEISGMMKGSPDIAALFKAAEGTFGKLTYNQQNSIIWMYDYLGLKKEVILVLLGYCSEIEKTNPGYVEKIACSWAENDINTLNAAQNEVERMRTAKEFTKVIMKMFEMEKSPTPKQSEFITSWKTAGFTPELIKLAYENTLDNINKLSFDYINKILLSWRNSGYTTPQQVKDAEAAYRKGNSSSRRGKSSEPDVEKYKVVINKF